jgi:hypothetical protein
VSILLATFLSAALAPATGHTASYLWVVGVQQVGVAGDDGGDGLRSRAPDLPARVIVVAVVFTAEPGCMSSGSCIATLHIKAMAKRLCAAVHKTSSSRFPWHPLVISFVLVLISILISIHVVRIVGVVAQVF